MINFNTENRFPFIIGRRGGDKIKILDGLTQDEIIKNVSNILLAKKQLLIFKEKLISDLHILISQENDGKKRNKLLNLKRDIYNDRPLSKYEKLNITNLQFSSDLNYYKELYHQYNNKLDLYLLEFTTAHLQSVRHLIASVKENFFANALLFSSHLLLDEITKIDLEKYHLNNKNTRLLNTSLKYLTRSLTKTTPLSSFNTVFFLKEANNKYESIDLSDCSKIQITNLFHHFLKEDLLNEVDFILSLRISANEVMWQEQQQNAYHFFFNDKNDESFKMIGENPILHYIRETLDDQDLTLAELTKNLAAKTDATQEELIDYLSSLADEGFLQIEYPFYSEDENWINKLLLHLNNSENLQAQYTTLINLLAGILEVIKLLEVLKDVGKKLSCSTMINSAIKEYFAQRGKPFWQKIMPQDLFYETVYCDSGDTVNSNDYLRVTKNLRMVFLTLNNVHYKIQLKKHLSDLMPFSEMQLLDFYKGVYLENIDNFSLTSCSLQVYESGILRLHKFINEYPNSPILDLSQFVTPEENSEDIITPIGAFIQTQDSSWKTIILNNFSDGYGSNVSRFFYGLSPSYSHSIRKYNDNLFNNTIIADVKDSSIHNVNNFPPLCTTVIKVNGEGKNYFEKKISLKDLYIQHDSSRGLILTDKNNAEILPIKFSLEGINRKSKMAQFLDLFNPTDNTGFTMYLESIKQIYESRLKKENCVFIPEIKYGNDIIIKRRQWLIKREILITLFKKVSYKIHLVYLEMLDFLTSYNLPMVFYIKISSGKNLSNDNYKPQYIDMESPIFVPLFIHLIEKADDSIELIDLNPDLKKLAEKSEYVKEYVLNF